MTTRAAQEQDREEMLIRMMRPRIWPRSVGELYARDDQPPPEFDDETTLYTHQAGEKYAWTQGKTIANQGRLMHLGSGMECQVYLKQGTIEGTPITYLSKHWPVQSAMRGFYPEMALYASTCFLRPLQGILVSRIIGIYSAPGGIVSVAMEPPHPHSWYEASRAMPDSYKQRFLDAYTRLHALGILHGDIELRHMLVTEDDRIHLIDFGLAQVLREGYDVLGLKMCEEADLEREMRRVKFVLDYPAGYAEQEIQRATANEEAVARGEEEDKDAIPLRTLEEEWGRSATEGGRRFVIPTDIPIISGPRKKRYAVQIPRAGGEEAEVEQILTPSHKDGASSNETLVVKSDPDSPRPAAPAEPVVKKEEEDVKPVIKKEEEDAAPAVKKEEEVEPVIKDEPRDDAPPLVPVPSTSQKRGRDDDEEDASDSPTKRSRASPPPPAPTPAAAVFGNLASARMLKTIAPTQRNWNAAKTGSIVDAFICRYMCIKVKQFPLTHMFPPDGVDAPVISYDKNTRELRPRDLARQLVHQQAHEAARRMCAANGGKPVTEKETLVFAGVYDVESIARFYLRTDDGGAFPSKTLPATVVGAAPAPVAGSSRAGAMPPPPPVTAKRARGAEPSADAESPPKRARRAAPAPVPEPPHVHIADRSPSPRLSPPRRIKSPDLPADTVLPPTLPLSELVVTAIFGKSTPKADHELSSTRATLGRKTRKQRREERELDAEIAAEEAAAAAAVPRVVVQSPTPGPARPLSVRPQAAERLAAPRRGRSRGATPKGR